MARVRCICDARAGHHRSNGRPVKRQNDTRTAQTKMHIEQGTYCIDERSSVQLSALYLQIERGDAPRILKQDDFPYVWPVRACALSHTVV